MPVEILLPGLDPRDRDVTNGGQLNPAALVDDLIGRDFDRELFAAFLAMPAKRNMELPAANDCPGFFGLGRNILRLHF